MFSDMKIFLTVAFLPVLLYSCSSMRSHSYFSDVQERVELSVPMEKPLPERNDAGDVVVDSAEVSGGPVIMNAIRDSGTGEMTATDIIAASRIVARFRNVAERLGRITLTFDVIVPEALISSDFQLRISPVIEAKDSEYPLDPIFITGKNYRRKQLRGYERYRNFLESIVTDSSAFIRIELLETFLKRHFPETFAMKNDSSIVPEPMAENLFGVNQAEALSHYTMRVRKRRNAMKMESRDRMFGKYVRAPFVGGAVLDTVMSAGSGSLMYRYTHEMQSSPGLRKVYVGLEGSVFRNGEKVDEMPAPESLTFYISSLSSLADDTPRYVFKVVERVVTDNTNAFLDFGPGSAEIDTLSEGNAAELKRIRKCFDDIYSRKDLVLDSIVVTASCSPEGSWTYNRRLAESRAAAVKSYVLDNVRGLDDRYVRSMSVPENWDRLSRMASNDSMICPESVEAILAAAVSEDRDEAERKFAALPEYRYLREKIYPRLRTVNFNFHMHRPGMQKDTVHTTEIDTVYMRGVAALKNLNYREAAAVLRPYGDYNSALAMASSGYDEYAFSILAAMEERDARADYLYAILLSRRGDFGKAAAFYEKSMEKDPSLRHRANLDPEMSEVLRLRGECEY